MTKGHFHVSSLLKFPQLNLVQHTIMRHLLQSQNPKQADPQEMSAAKLDVAFRDSCARLLIDLNQCRRLNFYMPWCVSQLRIFSFFSSEIHFNQFFASKFKGNVERSDTSSRNANSMNSRTESTCLINDDRNKSRRKCSDIHIQSYFDEG